MGVTLDILDFDTRTPERVIATNVAADTLDAIDTAEANELSGVWEEDATQGSPRTGYVLKPDTGLTPVNPDLRILFCGGGTGPANNLVGGQTAQGNSVYVGVSVNGGSGTLNADILNAAAGEVYTSGSANFSGWMRFKANVSSTDLQFVTEPTGQAIAGTLKQTASDLYHCFLAGAFGQPIDDSEAGDGDPQMYCCIASGNNQMGTTFDTSASQFTGGNRHADGPAAGYDWGADTWHDMDRMRTSYVGGATYPWSAIGARGALGHASIPYAKSYYSTTGNPLMMKLRQVYYLPHDFNKRNLVTGTAKAFLIGRAVGTRGPVLAITNYRAA